MHNDTTAVEKMSSDDSVDDGATHIEYLKIRVWEAATPVQRRIPLATGYMFIPKNPFLDSGWSFLHSHAPLLQVCSWKSSENINRSAPFTAKEMQEVKTT